MFAKSVSEEKFASFVQSLEQRLLFIEQKNYMLEQRINALQSENQILHQALERRITDFTDVWHPMMMDNVNRIKTELVGEVEKANDNLEQRLLEKTHKDCVEKDPLHGCVLVGMSVLGIPCFCNKNTASKEVFLLLMNGTMNGTHCKYRERFTLFIESLLIIEDKQFDLQWWMRGCEIVLNGKLITRSLNERQYQYHQLCQNNILIELCKLEDSIKTIYKFCKENEIKFLLNNQPNINNIPFETIFK